MTERPLSPAWFWGVPVAAAAALLIVGLTHGNLAIFHALNGLSRHTGADLWAHITILGDTSVALTLLLPFLWRKPELLWAAVIAALLSTLWVHGLKPAFEISRPPGVLPADSFLVIGPDYRQSSFPSGHATTIFTLAGVIGLYLARAWLLTVLIVIAVIVAISRSVVGVHWPLDIFAGALGGWLAALAGLYLASRRPNGCALPAQLVIGAILALTAIYLLFWHDTDYEHVLLMQRLIAVACLLAAAFNTWRFAQQRSAAAA